MRDAESRFADSTQSAAVVRRAGALAVTCLSAVALLLSVLGSPAQAAYIHKPAGTFQLQSLSSGQPGSVAVDEQTGDVYVMRGSCCSQWGYIEKFDAEGNPITFPGIPGPSESQTVHFEGSWVSGDTFTLTCPNSETTAPIEWYDFSNVSGLQANIKSALETKCGGTFSVESGPYNPVVHFEGTFAHTNVPKMTCATVTGSGTCEITNEQNGAAETDVLPTVCEGGCYQIAIDNSGGPNQGVIYVSSAEGLGTCCPSGNNPRGGISVYLPSGEHIATIYTHSQTEFNVHACGVGVDEDGNLIVAHGESNTEFSYIDKLGVEPWATHPEQVPPLLGTLNSETVNPCKAQLDSAGNVYIEIGSGFGGGELKSSTGAVRKYAPNFHEPSGIAQIPPELRDRSTLAHAGPDRGFAFDSEDNLFGVRPQSPARVQKVDQAGSVTETFGKGEFFEPMDIAVDKATGTVYVTDGSFNSEAKDVHIFEALKVPNSLTGSFKATGQHTGTLHGELDPAEAGEVTGCKFEYTTEALFNSKEFEEAKTATCAEGTNFTEPEEVSAEIEELTLEETYYFRLATENANGASDGTVHKFVPHAVIDLTTKPATNVAPRSATLHASFTGNEDETEYFFEYGHGLPGVYTATTPAQSIPNPTGEIQLSVPVSELELETTYHFRIVAVNSTGTSKGFDESFTTPPAVSQLVTEQATGISQQGITLNAKFQGDLHDTHYFFEYGTTNSYGMVSDEEPGKDAGVTTGPTPISSEIHEYQGYTTYHYRVVASNEFGTTYGKDRTFTTLAAPLPEITETAVANIAPTTASLSAMVNPNRWATVYLFEWGTSTAYGTAAEPEELLGGLTDAFVPVNADISGLEPGTVYHFRAVAINFTGVTNGPDQTFVTPDVPAIDSASSSAVGQTTAHLSARVIGNASPTSAHFEFGPSTAYGSLTGSTAIGSSLLAREASADLTGLNPGTTYHYRVVAVNGIGTTTGSDLTFTTLPAAAPPPPPPPPKPRRCPRGKVRRHGKCVPRHKHHKHRRVNGRRHG